MNIFLNVKLDCNDRSVFDSPIKFQFHHVRVIRTKVSIYLLIGLMFENSKRIKVGSIPAKTSHGSTDHPHLSLTKGAAIIVVQEHGAICLWRETGRRLALDVRISSWPRNFWALNFVSQSSVSIGFICPLESTVQPLARKLKEVHEKYVLE